jgi:hypothetical protein
LKSDVSKESIVEIGIINKVKNIKEQYEGSGNKTQRSSVKPVMIIIEEDDEKFKSGVNITEQSKHVDFNDNELKNSDALDKTNFRLSSALDLMPNIIRGSILKKK